MRLRLQTFTCLLFGFLSYDPERGRRDLGEATASRQFSASCTGFQCGSASSSKSPPSSTRRRLGTVADDCFLVTDAPRPTRLHSADTRTLPVSWTRTNFGDRAFSAAGPCLELSAYVPPTSGLVIQPLKILSCLDFFIWSVGRQRIVHPFNCDF